MAKRESGGSFVVVTEALKPYRGSYSMPAFERATVADAAALDIAGALAWSRG